MKKKQKCDLGGFLSAVSPLLGLIPGVGAIASPLAGIAGGMISQANQNKNQPYAGPPMQENTNPYGFAMGGYMKQQGPDTQEVIGNNSSKVDGVELSQAYVDHGETISNTSQGPYVFSDILKNPLTGNSFAKDDMKIAMSDKYASKKPYDKEAQNTLKMNEQMRQQLATVNTITKGLTEMHSMMKKGMFKGGYMKPSYGPGGPLYQTGYQAPWNDFNIAEFQKYAGLTPDNIYGQKTHNALLGDLGKQYAAQSGYAYDPDTKGYLSATGVSAPRYDSGTFDVNDLVTANSLANMKPSFFKDVVPKDYLNDLPPTTLPTDNTQITNDPIVNLSRFGAGITSDGNSITPPEVQNRGVGIGKFLGNNLGTGLQIAGLLGQGATLLQKPERQNLYQNTAPINQQQYDPSSALNRSQYSFNALKNNISNSVGDASRMSNLQQGFANKTMNEADIIKNYDEMNKQSQRDYEARLAQRQGENIQYKYNTDQMNSQNKAARGNAFRQFLATTGQLGGEINAAKSNKQSAKMLIDSYGDINQYMKYIEELLGKNKK